MYQGKRGEGTSSYKREQNKFGGWDTGFVLSSTGFVPSNTGLSHQVRGLSHQVQGLSHQVRVTGA